LSHPRKESNYAQERLICWVERFTAAVPDDLMAPVKLLHAEVVCQQFLKGQPLLRRMPAFDQGGDISPGRRAVNVRQRAGQGWNFQVSPEVVRKKLLELQLLLAQHLESLVAQLDPACLAQAFHGGVNGRQAVGYRLVLFAEQALVAGVHHFQPLVAAPHLAVTTHSRAP